jgi:transposase
MLGYKADEEGCVFRQLDPKKRTTGVCPNTLQSRTPKLTLEERTWTCDCCGQRHDRDVAAAQVIKILGQDVTHMKRVKPRKRTLSMADSVSNSAVKRGAAVAELSAAAV